MRSRGNLVDNSGCLDISLVALAPVARVDTSEIIFGILFGALDFTGQKPRPRGQNGTSRCRAPAGAELSPAPGWAQTNTGAIPLDGLLIMLHSLSKKSAVN